MVRLFRKRRPPAEPAPAKAAAPPAEAPKHRSVAETHGYWREPDGLNDPLDYLENEGAQKRSWYLVRRVRDLVAVEASLFELGCNVGRNLSHLYKAGYRDLTGLEINENAIEIFRERLPEVAATTTLHVGSVETLIPAIADSSFDLTFTMAVLEHIHTESEWVFEHLARITKGRLLTIEDESCRSWRHFPRNYQPIFEKLGLRQVAHEQLNTEDHGLSKAFHARVFER